jgi:hypothetical protein
MDFNDLKESMMRQILQNLFLVTLKYGDEHPYHIEHIWTTVGEKYENIAPLIKFLLETGFKKVIRFMRYVC